MKLPAQSFGKFHEVRLTQLSQGTEIRRIDINFYIYMHVDTTKQYIIPVFINKTSSYHCTIGCHVEHETATPSHPGCYQ